MASLSKNKIKYIHSLELKKIRKEERVFLAEGPKLVGDLLGHFPCRFLAATPSWFQEHPGIDASELVEVSQEDLSRASLLKTPQQVLAIFEQPQYTLDPELEKLTGHIKEVDGLKVNFGVYEVVDVNAFACGDGSVRICAGLMDIMTDDEVMAVVGHEIGHVIHTDSKDAMKSAYLRSAVKNAAGAASSTVSKLTDSELGAMAEALAGAQYSQKQETEADDYGFEFSIKHNLDPYAMYNALNKLLELSADAPKESKFQKMFSSHPDTAKRVARAKEKADEYMKNKQ